MSFLDHALIAFIVEFIPLQFALAEEVGEHSDILSELTIPLLNFGIYAVLLVYLYRKYIANALKARTIQVKQDLDKSARTIAEAEAEFLDVSQRLSGIDAEKKELLERLKSDGVRISELIIENANRSAIRLQSDTKRQIQNETEAARKLIRKQIIESATSQAREKFRTGLAAEADRQLRQDALRHLFE